MVEMKLSLLLCVASALLAHSAPVQSAVNATCSSKSQRKAWYYDRHMLSNDEKSAYIEAEKCLMKLPAKLGLKGARTRFDEFQSTHIAKMSTIHGVGAFLPFHRYFVHAHEQLLRTECNYQGAQPYWDETHDAGNFSGSSVLDPITGFGGNGQGTNNCIKDGPFKDYVNAMGPGTLVSDHCIDRQVNNGAGVFASKQFVDQCLETKTFSTAWACLEALPHTAGHGGIGGQMLNLWSSPGDPIFYLHHTWLDKLWWTWQAKDLPARLTEITGQNTGSPFGAFPPNGTFPGFEPNGTFPGFPSNGTFPGFPPNGTFPGFPSNGTFPGFPPGSNGTFPGFPGNGNGTLEHMDGDPGNVTTLGHVLSVSGAIPNATIRDVMDIGGGYLCYEYV